MCPHKDLKIVPARLRHKTGKFFAASMIESVVYDSQFTDILGRKTKRFSEALFSAVCASCAVSDLFPAAPPFFFLRLHFPLKLFLWFKLSQVWISEIRDKKGKNN